MRAVLARRPPLLTPRGSLRAAGCLVVSLDYRNFPQGTVSDMTADVSAGVAWVLRHAAKWGGDCERCAPGGRRWQAARPNAHTRRAA